MNTRILDIIKNPEIIKIEDLKLLETEIEKLPYMQSLRAIYLLGVHKYHHNDFQQELTKTAAYTTDKKILYNLINQTKNTISKTIKKEENTISSDIQDKKTPTLTGIDYYTKNLPLQEKEPSFPALPKTTEEKPQYESKTHIMDFYTFSKKEEKNKIHSPINFYEKPIESIAENKAPKEEIIKNIAEDEEYQWKPMQLENTSSAHTDNKNTSIKIENLNDEKTYISTKQEDINNTIIDKELNTSNVSSFINTWQNWLKIDRTPQFTEQEKKSAIIDKFIENNPKISPIKDDIDFVVKEKSDDISHLMTETLAQLYLDQKLYSKAINAYKILQEKYPEKSKEFEKKLEEIKKNRNK